MPIWKLTIESKMQFQIFAVLALTVRPFSIFGVLDTSIVENVNNTAQTFAAESDFLRKFLWYTFESVQYYKL